MLRLPLIDDTLIEVMRLNARLANALGRVATEFLREVAETLSDAPLARASERRRGRVHREDSRWSEGRSYEPRSYESRTYDPRSYEPRSYESAPRRAVDEYAAPRSASAAAGPSTILLESEAGTVALGIFVIENYLPNPVTVQMEASAFTSPAQGSVLPRVQFHPNAVTLDPRQQLAMQVWAFIDETLVPEVGYRGEFRAPALPATRIPVVIRRRRLSPAKDPTSAASRDETPIEYVAPSPDADRRPKGDDAV